MSQLTLAQRYIIQAYKTQGISQKKIGEYIGKDKSVICRELQRNSDERSGEYRAELAQRKAENRHKTKPKHIRFTKEIQQTVRGYLEQDYSPDQITGRAKIDGVECVSPERIYQFVWADKKTGGKLYKHLRTKGKKYRKRGHSKDTRGQIVGRVDIDLRPKIVDDKERIGDLEIDLVIGKDHKQALLTINDRATGVLKMGKVSSKEASEIEAKTLELLEDWQAMIHTITSDNGKEFANHKNIAQKLNIDYYFAKPYHSWQRGANENLNGLVRQYFPKKSDFKQITEKQIIEVQKQLNNRPRKRFGYKTPNEIFAQKIEQQFDVAFIT